MWRISLGMGALVISDTHVTDRGAGLAAFHIPMGTATGERTGGRDKMKKSLADATSLAVHS